MICIASIVGKFQLPKKGSNIWSLGIRNALSTASPKIGDEKRSSQEPREDHRRKYLKIFDGPTRRGRRKTQAIRVVTDIDDTVVSSGGLSIFGIHLGGVDNRFKRGQFYPGAINFALELSKFNPNNLNNTANGKLSTRSAEAKLPKSSNILASATSKELDLPARVAVLTARAKEFKFALALKPTGKLFKAYQHVGKKHGAENWGIGDVYYGSVAEWILQGRKGLRKYKNFQILMKEDDIRDGDSLTHKYIIIGDTGEKDEDAAERAARQYSDRLHAVFMHQVFNINKKPNHLLRADRNVNGVPFYYFRTYVGAGIKAYRNNLISKESLKRITSHAVADLTAIDQQLALADTKNPFARFRKEKLTALQKLRWDEIRSDANECAFLNPLLDEPKLAVV